MDSTATPRRSARIGSVARSVTSQAVPATTPTARETPARGKPLPKIKSRKSTAYGASGRQGAAEELVVQQTGFTEAFDTQRGAAVARNEESIMSGGLNGQPPHNSATPARGASAPSQEDYESDSPLSEHEPVEEDSGANTSKSFGMANEAGMLHNAASTIPATSTSVQARAVYSATQSTARRPLEGLHRPDIAGRSLATPLYQRPLRAPIQEPAAPIIAARSPLSRPVQVSEGSGEAAPESSRSAERQRPGNQKRWPSWCIYLLGVCTVLILVVANSVYQAIPEGVVSASVKDGMKSLAVRVATEPSGGRTKPNPYDFRKRLDSFEYTLTNMHRYIYSLGDDVPDWVVVSKSDRTGGIKISPEFWEAIRSRMINEENTIEWENFLAKNEKRLKNMISNEVAITWEEFKKALEVTLADIAADLDKKLTANSQRLLVEFKESSARYAKEAAMEVNKIYASVMTNMMANMELHTTKVNYFAQGLGTIILTDITSPSHTQSPLLMRFWQRLLTYPTNPPTVALNPWTEPGECWCAAPDNNGTGRVQLGIQLRTPIYPNQITIEHLPMAAAPRNDVSSAPRDVEIWAKSDKPALMRLGYEGKPCEPGPDGWQCLGKVRYDIFGSNHVQSFALDSETRDPVDQVMVRVINSWGAPNTCIYRVRLHGKDLDAPHDYKNLRE